MKNHIKDWLSPFGIELSQIQMALAVLLVIVVISVVIHLVLHRVVLKTIERMAKNYRRNWRTVLFEEKLFSRLALTLQGVLIHAQAILWLNEGSTLREVLSAFSLLWVILFIMLTFFSVIDAFAYFAKNNKKTKNLPIQGFLQAIKLFIALVAIIFMIAVVIGRSPMLIVSGLGAMTAVMMLVFKDPIMGFVAGIQLSVNDMLRIGDWLDMPSYGADGDVIEIGLTTVKVQNWDKTITTIPTYALISDSFKNWQGMTESGGRRIKRAIYLDVSSIKFLDEALMARLNQAKLLAPYLSEKSSEIEVYNQKEQLNLEVKINGRRLTNIGTMRAYLINYLQNHPSIHKDMTLMVRQLAAEDKGVPLQIYAFTNTTDWAEYEQIQSDIFDHIYAVVDAFDLRIHQSVGGADVRSLLLMSKTNEQQEPKEQIHRELPPKEKPPLDKQTKNQESDDV
ncbi:mechanosensitive ion channel family protein [Marinicella rhabdoformis]|uniref:mechanosensitive ion channel family protein n=1 Tax=Marinicella rhabdoformis TaxID=2580566 RepID=UPI0012AEBED3|nr:mechanosensitive ion channel domain-containing protein [Marinicella rhabdoformis]